MLIGIQRLNEYEYPGKITRGTRVRYNRATVVLARDFAINRRVEIGWDFDENAQAFSSYQFEATWDNAQKFLVAHKALTLSLGIRFVRLSLATSGE